ncbi:hypothetical protein [Nocardia sp. NPDC004860]|uniref:hypothetical protein n=1 Tax=Nocardia sp. NPDC004860 TaxID=3154557 RepID=UPI0033A56A6E
MRANGTYWVERGAVAVAEFPRYRWLGERSMAVPEIAVFEDDMLVLVDAAAGLLPLARRIVLSRSGFAYSACVFFA